MGGAALGELLDAKGCGVDGKGFFIHGSSVKKRGAGIEGEIGHVLGIAVGQVEYGGDVAAWPKVIL